MYTSKQKYKSAITSVVTAHTITTTTRYLKRPDTVDICDVPNINDVNGERVSTQAVATG